VLALYVTELEKLRAENENLKAGLDAHSTLKSIYADANQPAGVRVRAASAALNVETPSLKPEPRPLDLVAEPSPPLAELVHQQRARMDHMHRERRNIQVLPSGAVRVLSDGNGSDDSDY
jgi:hypothetical protein